MALKYYFEFTSTNVISTTESEKIEHRCEIYNDDFEGDATRVYGKCSLTKATTKDTLEVIRGGGLKVELEADSDLTFSDLYSDNERVFSVKYIRDSVTMFVGWLSPEGLFQSLVADRWVINLDCTDGLGFLNNLSYVDNDTKELFTGKQKDLEIVVNCLKRTGLEQDIYVLRSSIVYGTQPSVTNVLDQVYANAVRYIKDDQITTMTCEEVLRTVLEKYAMCITQRFGKWFIYKPNDLYRNSNHLVYRYESDGTPYATLEETLNFSETIGNISNDFYPFHIGGQQQLSIAQSIGAYRINYKYGLVKSFFENIYLESSGDPETVDEWTINDYTYIDFPSDNLGLIYDALPLDNPISTPLLIMTSDSFSFEENNEIEFKTVISKSVDLSFKQGVKIYFKVILTDGVSTYYLDNQGNWQSSTTFIEYFVYVNEYVNVIKSAFIPIDGTINIESYTPVVVSEQGIAGDPLIYLKECRIAPATTELEDVQGEIHTFQITDNPSTKIEDTKEVYNGDSASDVYSGTLYQNDGITPTELWIRYTDIVSNFKPLLQMTGEERMKMYARPLKVFTGEVMGFVDYLTVISIDGIDGLFMPTEEYSYNAKQNTTKFKLKEILNESIGSLINDGITYTSYLDTGEAEEPTIN